MRRRITPLLLCWEMVYFDLCAAVDMPTSSRNRQQMMTLAVFCLPLRALSRGALSLARPRFEFKVHAHTLRSTEAARACVCASV